MRAWPWFAVLAVYLALRLLAGWPAGVDRDENQHCWNGRCLAVAGTDFRGNPWPLVLEDYGDDKQAFYAWLLAGLGKLGLEMRPERARVFSMVLVGLGALLFGLAAGLRLQHRGAGVLAMGLVAFLPWFQVGPCLAWGPPTNVAAYGAMFWSLSLAHDKGRRAVGGLLFVVSLAFGAYGYPGAKVLAPFLLAAGCLLVWRSWGARVAVGAAGCLLLLPLLLDHLLIGSHTDRAQTILVPDLATFGLHWISHYSPAFLLYEGDLGDVAPRHFSGFLGVLPWAMVAALVYVLFGAARRRRWWPSHPVDRFALLALLIFPLPAALTEDGLGHVHRSLLGAFAFSWFAIGGLRQLTGKARPLARLLVLLAAVQCVGNLVWMRVAWRDAEATKRVFHGTFYRDLREVVLPLQPARVLFSAEPEPLVSAFPYIHFGWTALSSRPVPGEFDPVVTELSGGYKHLQTTGDPQVSVWQRQPPLERGPDLLIQVSTLPPPPGFRPTPGLAPPLMLWIREAAQ